MPLDWLPPSLAVLLANLDITEFESKFMIEGAQQNVSRGSLLRSNVNVSLFLFLDVIPQPIEDEIMKLNKIFQLKRSNK